MDGKMVAVLKKINIAGQCCIMVHIDDMCEDLLYGACALYDKIADLKLRGYAVHMESEDRIVKVVL